MSEAMAFIDLAAQQRRIRADLDRRIAAVLDHGKYIMGPEVALLEARLAELCGARHALSCANGTDALVLALMALDLGPGDAVFVPAFTFAATAEAVALRGATPIFVDVLEHTFNLDPASLRRGLETAATHDLRPVGVIPVDLFGLPADYVGIQSVADAEGLWVLADSAQAFAATHHGRRAGALAAITTTSFFPAKPLGCYGDGGAVFTEDDDLAQRLRSLRVHGKGTHKYDNERIGLNSRLDTLQAAILLAKLDVYEDEIERRDEVAGRYTALLDGRLGVPRVPTGLRSVWAQYTVRLPDHVSRPDVQKSLTDQGIPSAIYYPTPLHRQTAYASFPCAVGGLEVSEWLADRVLSLPMHPYLEPEQQARVARALARALG